MKRFFVVLMLLSGCAGPSKVLVEKIPPPVPVAAHPPREMLVFVPQTDDAAVAWLKWFGKVPDLRMVIAMSPRFQRVMKDPHLKAQFQGLIKQGRLELALQLPNAPILPLLMQDPPYGFSDDVIQLIAQSKAGFFKQWGVLPRGLVLPYGAASPALLTLLEKLGIYWVVGAFELPAVDGPTLSGSMMLWDGTAQGKTVGTLVRVWDERQAKDHSVEAWLAPKSADLRVNLLPQDSGIMATPLLPKIASKTRTWIDPDLSAWVGTPPKNAGWSALRKTRQALESYKNSGQASVQRLDVAFEELYTAQNSNYFLSMGNTTLSPALTEEREHEFQATLLAVYRLIGQAPPEDLFSATTPGLSSTVHASSTVAHAESFPDGREHVSIEDAVGDALVSGGPDLQSLDVWATTVSVHWSVTLASAVPAVVDIYVDLNGQPNAGTPTFLQGRPYGTAPTDAWEYALSFSGSSATLYRTQGTGTYGTVQSFPAFIQGNVLSTDIPRDLMRGAPKRWGYQVLVMTGDPATLGHAAALSDFIDPLEISQKDLWQDLIEGKRTDIPFVHVRNR